MLFWLLFGQLCLVRAHKERINERANDLCEGIYGAHDIPFAARNAEVEITFDKLTAPTVVTVLVYNIRDEPLLEFDGSRFNVGANGTFLFNGLPDDILNKAIPVNSSEEVSKIKVPHTITKTGFYCVVVADRNAMPYRV